MVTQQAGAPSWSGWIKQHSDSHCMIMDASSILPYGPRPVTSAPLERPLLSSHYVMNTPYSPAPMTTMPSAAFQPQPSFAYSPYPQLPTPMGSPLAQQLPPPTRLVMSTKIEAGRPTTYSPGHHAQHRNGSRSPPIKNDSAKNELQPAKVQGPPSPSNKFDVVTPKEIAQETLEWPCSTEVDTLMKAIQAKEESDVGSVGLEKLKEEIDSQEMGVTLAQLENTRRRGRRHTSPKPYRCRAPGCQHFCTQKTHLEIHMRKHTGERPYECDVPGCGRTFAQKGNLKTHARLHTGEKPFRCQLCGRTFAQRGNVSAHLETHKGEKNFLCILDGCNKKFSQRGNLKVHQNKYHVQSLQEYGAKFASMPDNIDLMSPADREVFHYFADLYKHSNKGIKGRGRNRRVQTVAQLLSGDLDKNNINSPCPAPWPAFKAVVKAETKPTTESQARLQHPQQFQQPQPQPHPPMVIPQYPEPPSLPLSASHPLNQSPTIMVAMLPQRKASGSFEIFDAVSSPGPAAPISSGPVFNGDNGRGELPPLQ